MLALLEAGHSFEHVARAAGVTKQAIHYQFPGFKKEKSKADATWREEEYKQSAPYFRKLAREELRAAGWGKCYLQCREWHPPERMNRNRCKFCDTERSRKVYAVSVGLEFIPNDPAVWWRQFETGEKRKRLVRRIRVDRRIKLPEREPVNLTQYEAEVYALVREGLPHSQIAEKLSKTKSAIRCAMQTVRRKAKQL
jgi:AcrR family transcriptional regulator